MPKLTDKQREAVLHDDGNILVSASAGSGKTHTMIERVKRLILEKNVNVSEILCVTFTEKAAYEMKEKLKNALYEKAEGENRRLVLSQLAVLPTADISTLHSFCGKLIRSNFFAVGVSPDFKVMDENETKAMRLECVDKAFREFYDGGEEWFYTLIDRHCGRTDEALKEMVLSTYVFCDSEADPDALLNKYVYYYSESGRNELYGKLMTTVKERLAKMREGVQNELGILQSYKLPKGIAFASALLSDINTALTFNSVYDFKRFENYELRLDFERKIDPTAVESKEVLKVIRDEFKKYMAKLGGQFIDEQTDLNIFSHCAFHTKSFLKVVKKFKEIYDVEKREENVLDFNDLEHFALKILDDENIRQAVAEKYKYVFVDEYQDINDTQEKIITKLASNNLFMVGDNKQSIYGFRGCRPEFFAEKKKSMDASGQKTLTLNHNFRSSGAVINTVNKIFDFCMNKKFFGENYAETSRLIAGAGWATEQVGRANLHFLKTPEKEKALEERPRVYDVLEEIKNKEEQSPLISSLITKIIDDELTKTYYDPKTETNKKIKYGDVAILTRSKNSEYASKLVNGLVRHGIPVSSDVKENVCNFPEIAMLVNALKLVDCFKQDLPLASTLKSPIGKFSEEDFVSIVRFYQDANERSNQWGFYDAYAYYLENACTPLNQKLKEFNEYFNQLRFVADFVGAHGVLDRLIKDNALESYFYAQRCGKTKVGRLRRFVGACVNGGKNLNVKEFLYKIEKTPDAFGFADGGDEDAVKVMTIHASKGLEFPVVIVCGLERAFNDDDESEEILLSRKYGLAVKFYDDQKRVKGETLLRSVIKDDMRSERVKEEMRLFYVATTRAQFSLHLTFEGKEDKRKDVFDGANHFIDFIPDYISCISHDKEEFNFTDLHHGVRKVIIGKADEEVENQIRQNLSHQYPFVNDTVLPLKENVTGAVSLKNDDKEFTHVLFDEPSPDVEKGNVAHKILQYMDFSFAKDFDAQVKDMVEAQILTQDEVLKVNLQRIRGAIKDSPLSNLSGFKLYREKSFIAGIRADKVLDAVTEENVVVQGIIDLLAIKGDVAYVVDYKYSSLEKNSLKEKYAKQLELYSLAVEQSLKIKVLKKIIVNLFTGDWVEID